MTGTDLDRELDSLRELLVRFADRIARGDRKGIYEGARLAADAVTCLIDEAPEHRQPELVYMLERYEALMSRLVN